MAKAIGMMSGGLDSTLAVKVLLSQGIEVLGVSFKSAFFGPQKAQKAAEKLGVDLRVIDIIKPHLEMTKNPEHGYGGNMNPCIDCHGMMFRYAFELMRKEGGDFVFSGEVLGQRPMSQNLGSLNVVAKLSGTPEKILRPMSAKRLLKTEMERSGMVNRDHLLDICGRSRKYQIFLAREWGITDYPSPAGGCLLTDPSFSRRLKDLFAYMPHASLKDIEMLKVGRHIRLNDNVKAIIGRNEKENDILAFLSGTNENASFFEVEKFAGPVTILSGNAAKEDISEAAAICAGYGKGSKEKKVSVEIKSGAHSEIICVPPALKANYQDKMI